MVLEKLDFPSENGNLEVYVGPVIFRFKKAIFRFKKIEIPFRFRFIIGNVEFDEITIYRKKVWWTDCKNGTISAVNWRKMTKFAWWTEEKGTINAWMDNKRDTAQSTLCVDNKKDKTELKTIHVWLKLEFFVCCNFTDSVSSRQFRDFSAIAENHWPYLW